MKSWKEKIQEICKLIKQVSDAHGGDDLEFLRSYCQDVLEKYKDNMDELISCFEYLAKGVEIDRVKPKKPFIPVICSQCGYRPPFCRFDLGEKCTNMDKSKTPRTVTNAEKIKTTH